MTITSKKYLKQKQHYYPELKKIYSEINSKLCIAN